MSYLKCFKYIYIYARLSWHHENTVVLLLQLPEDQICSKLNRYSFKLSLQVVSWGKILTNDILYSMCDGWPMLVCHLWYCRTPCSPFVVKFKLYILIPVIGNICQREWKKLELVRQWQLCASGYQDCAVRFTSCTCICIYL